MEDAAKTENIELQEYMLDYYKSAADYGNSAEAQYKVAQYYDQCYLKNRGETETKETKDALENAVAYYEKAANQGYQAAMRQLFERLSECGRPEEAAEWIHKLAESGDAEAQFAMGQCYALGNGVEQSMFEAIEWYCKSAEQGKANAQEALGTCYYYGKGIEKDAEKAFQWFEKAAERGHANQNNLAVCYMNGDGIEKDFKRGIEWLEKAAEQGDGGLFT